MNESLSKKMASRSEFDKTIAETEAAYMKVRVDDHKLKLETIIKLVNPWSCIILHTCSLGITTVQIYNRRLIEDF